MAADLASFNEYEKDFLALSSQLPIRLNSVMTYSSEAEANAELRRIESDMTQARQRLQDMEMEARGIPEPTRKTLGDKIRTYKASLEPVQADLKRAKDKYSRAALMGSPGGGGGGGAGGRPLDFDKSADARACMAAMTDKMRGGTATLMDAHTRLEETVSVGEGIMGELHRNRETLTRARGNVGVVSGTLDEARRILRSMARREVRTKVALGVFAVVLTGIIIGLIVWMVKKNNG